MTHKLEKKLLEEPIVLPANPIWEVMKVFGRDELIALILSTAGTAVIGSFVSNTAILAITGPVIEKVGLFLGHIKERAWMRNGFKSLMKDIVVHDPLYVFFMYVGLSTYNVPAWILSISSFVIALGIVAIGEVLVTEFRYYLKILGYKKMGFGIESYLESRFYIKKANTDEILADFGGEFGLTKRESAKYRDLYFESKLEDFNGRKPSFRLRQRGEENNQTLQIFYTKAAEMPNRQPGQFNYYPSRKDKIWIKLPQPMPWKIEDILDKNLRNFAKRTVNNPTKEIVFSREAIRNPKNILVSVDQIESGQEPLTVIEIKSRLDKESKKMLIRAMRHVMLKYEVIQTTHSKNALIY